MQWIFVLAAFTIALPLAKIIINSMRGLHVEPGQYYDFTPHFTDAKPWTVGLYVAVIAILTFIVFLVSGVGLLNLSA